MLSALLLIPIVGAIAIILWPGELKAAQARRAAMAILAFSLIWVVLLASRFDIHSSGMQFEEVLAWVEPLGLTYKLGMDGLSLPLLIINSLLSLVAIYATSTTIHRPRLYFSLMLLINGAVAGAFLSENLLLFFLFYELELIPLYLLIAIWGGARRGYAATKFLIYTALSGILILGAFLGLTWLSGSNSFDFDPSMAQTLTLTEQTVLLVTILIGFGIKVPLFPFHTWLPDAHVEASTPVSVLLAGVLLKLGTYGLLRFGFGLFPEAWFSIAPWLASWAVVSVLYGSLAAISQTDMKKMVAYSSVGHMGYVLLAAAAATPLSILGSVLQMISHGLISALLFLLVGVVYKKTGTRDLTVLRGLLNPERGLPIIGSLMILGVMASAGIPGMVGFISEFLVFRGSFTAFSTQTLLCMLGSGLTSVYFLLLVNRSFFGRLAIAPPTATTQLDVNLPPVAWSDRFPAVVLALIILALGLQPSWMTRWSENTTLALHQPYSAVAQLSHPQVSQLPISVSCSDIADEVCQP
ncbi:NADH-quinone oxidoreductase subunit M [Pseudanabaena sp. FACHB-2040]|uniref:NADH-quinone oxidoreductase subunit M n=1 Tax=Pseudanabaena sp. FACHB-2040 TaxID=2692859 RepID=UPI001685DFC4|nr:NADH-quinone oxidoreductase subunit M [Pseudanabaena sp. FACHB-2040]MBD2258943.1 NADH-quinone oxidoreductase subunit M [Pseudanabaena sp. FACHB-2040]